MSRPFFITGLPRSRTAWFSVAMRGRKSFCLHEPTAHAQSFDELKAMWSDDRWEHMGVSDSCLGFQLGRIMQDVAPRTLIIERPIDEVIASLSNLLRYEVATWRKEFEGLWQSIEEYRHHPLVHCVAYRDLRNPSVLNQACDWLVGGQGEQALTLQHINIQADMCYAREVARRPHSRWHLEREMVGG